MTEDLLIALAEWMEAKAVLQKCYDNCDSSPDYFCHNYAEREQVARALVGVKLEQIIDARIEAATGARP